jgi:hypothetical protein
MGVAEMKGSEWADLLIRFVVGGTILVVVYVMAMLMPWRSIAGVFAAFPGVMSSAVGLTGWRQDSLAAAEVAKGSVLGMLGGLVCVLATLATLTFIKLWWVGLMVGILAWFAASFLLNAIIYGKNKIETIGQGLRD